MATAAFHAFNCFVEDVCEKKHNLGSDVLKVMLTLTAPTAASTVYTGGLASTELANGAGYTTGGATASIGTSTQTAGTYKLVLNDATWTASAAMGPFRYAVLYNSTNTADNKPLIGWWDNGVNVTLANTEQFTVDYDAAAGVLTITSPP